MIQAGFETASIVEKGHERIAGVVVFCVMSVPVLRPDLVVGIADLSILLILALPRYSSSKVRRIARDTLSLLVKARYSRLLSLH